MKGSSASTSAANREKRKKTYSAFAAPKLKSVVLRLAQISTEWGFKKRRFLKHRRLPLRFSPVSFALRAFQISITVTSLKMRIGGGVRRPLAVAARATFAPRYLPRPNKIALTFTRISEALIRKVFESCIDVGERAAKVTQNSKELGVLGPLNFVQW